MNIKDLIKREALVKEAITYRVESKDFYIPERFINKLKKIIKNSLKELEEEFLELSRQREVKLSAEEIQKQARAFMKNYLKGVI